MIDRAAVRLRALHDYLVTTYSYYQNREEWRRGFSSLPLVDKKTISRNRDQFEHPSMHPEMISYTSGTTGVPFRCARTRQEQLALSMALHRHRSRWGIKPRHHMLLLSNRMLDDSKALDHYAMQMTRTSPDLIQGRSAALHALATYCRRQGIKAPSSLKLVQNWGEYMQPHHKEVIEAAFGVPCADYYGLEELWLIAFTDHTGRLRVDEKSVYVEIVDSGTRRPLPEGEWGEIAVTSYIMQSVPYVRYLTGDIGRLIRDEVIGGSYLELLPVRSAHIQLPDRNVHASILRYLDRFFHALSIEQGVSQYQLVQEQYDSFKLLLVAQSAIETERLSARLGPLLSGWLSSDVSVRVELVSAIKPNPGSGKTLSFVSLISGGQGGDGDEGEVR